MGKDKEKTVAELLREAKELQTENQKKLAETMRIVEEQLREEREKRSE